MTGIGLKGSSGAVLDASSTDPVPDDGILPILHFWHSLSLSLSPVLAFSLSLSHGLTCGRRSFSRSRARRMCGKPEVRNAERLPEVRNAGTRKNAGRTPRREWRCRRKNRTREREVFWRESARWWWAERAEGSILIFEDVDDDDNRVLIDEDLIDWFTKDLGT